MTHSLSAFLVGLLPALILGLLNGGNPAYIDVNPHPYLFCLGILSVLAGLKPALLLGVVYGGFYFFYEASRLDVLEVESVFSANYFKFPLSFLLTCFAFGVVGDAFRRKTKGIEDENQKLLHNLGESAVVRQRLTAESQNMERRLAARVQSALEIFRFGRESFNISTELLGVRFYRFLSEYFSEEDFAIYRFEHPGLRRLAPVVADQKRFPKEISRKEFSEISEIGYAISNRDVFTFQLYAGENAAGSPKGSRARYPVVVPLMDDSQNILGVILFHSFQFMNYKSSNFAALRELSRWFGVALRKSQGLTQNQEDDFWDFIGQCFSTRVLDVRAEEDWLLAKKTKINLSLLEWTPEWPDVDFLEAREIVFRKAFSRALSDGIAHLSLAGQATFYSDPKDASFKLFARGVDGATLRALDESVTHEYARLRQFITGLPALGMKRIEVNPESVKSEDKNLSWKSYINKNGLTGITPS